MTVAFKGNQCLPFNCGATLFLNLLVITRCPTKQLQNHLMFFISWFRTFSHV